MSKGQDSYRYSNKDEFDRDVKFVIERILATPSIIEQKLPKYLAERLQKIELWVDKHGWGEK